MLMKGTEGANIINITSDGAFRARSGKWVYDATKAGLASLTRTMAFEFWPYGIRVNAVAPGWSVTEMHYAKHPDSEARKRELESMDTDYCIMRRLGRPKEIANAILFLASGEASYITATTLHVDGGRVVY
jgi:NAD(P)-dependent dehydrogenase (short-subunit alcohol dehydrogenase family)